MSYRTYINNTQIFGNNEYYKEWIDFIKSEGVEVDLDGNYDGYITNFMGALCTIEKIIIRLEEDYRKNHSGDSLFNFTNHYDNYKKLNQYDDDYNTSITDTIYELANNAYVFMSYALVKCCEDIIEKDKSWSTPNHHKCYKLKPGMRIHVEAR